MEALLVISIAAAVLLILLIAISNIKLKFDCRLRAQICEIRIRIISLFIPIDIRIRAAYNYAQGIQIHIIKRNGQIKKSMTIGERTKHKSVPISLQLFHETLVFEKLFVGGEVGVKNDSFASVIVAGALNVIINTILPAIITIRANNSVAVYISPRYTINVFAINMQGILTLNAGKLIHRIVVNMIRRQKLKEDNKIDTSNRKPNAVVFDTDQRAC